MAQEICKLGQLFLKHLGELCCLCLFVNEVIKVKNAFK